MWIPKLGCFHSSLILINIWMFYDAERIGLRQTVTHQICGWIRGYFPQYGTLNRLITWPNISASHLSSLFHPRKCCTDLLSKQLLLPAVCCLLPAANTIKLFLNFYRATWGKIYIHYRPDKLRFMYQNITNFICERFIHLDRS